MSKDFERLADELINSCLGDRAIRLVLGEYMDRYGLPNSLHRYADQPVIVQLFADRHAGTGALDAMAVIAPLLRAAYKPGRMPLAVLDLYVGAWDVERKRIIRLVAEGIATSIDAKEAGALTVAEGLPDGPASLAAHERASAINGCAWIARDYAKREA